MEMTIYSCYLGIVSNKYIQDLSRWDKEMKKLIFCFDGTWNDIKSTGDGISNVAKFAAMLDNVDGNGNPQIIHYDTGVGTGRRGRLTEGATGKGVLENIREAYLFLCMNFVEGDEISVFGFSRGAFTARSFAGLIEKCGIMRRAQIERAVEATELYSRRAKMKTKQEKDYLMDCFQNLKVFGGCSVNTSFEDEKFKSKRKDYEKGSHEMVKITYLGLWDTVGAMIDLDRSDVEFHSIDIPDCALAARHAVAIDEYRPHFDIDLLDNIDIANKRIYDDLDEETFEGTLAEYKMSADRAFQEVWFPGEHGSVGGGGDVLGLSDEALLWVMDGAVKHAGLKLDTNTEVSKVFGLRPTPLAPLDNTMKDSFKESIMEKALNKHFKNRKKGPKGIHEVSQSASLRFLAPANSLPEKKVYRPESLNGLSSEIKKRHPNITDEDYKLYNGYSFGAECVPLGEPITIKGKKLEFRTIKPSESLSTVAKDYTSTTYKDLQSLNKIMISNADRIFVGQIINVPVN